jgi:hypothetical protein
MLIEQQNLLFRLNMIKTWAQIKLKEFSDCFTQVYTILDNWIVAAVEKEN